MSTSRNREQGQQNIAWFRDQFTRGLLELDPPYQRRSVWTPKYREDFIDTIFLNYPAPAIFLYETIDDEGVAAYAVVDGKQRLKTVLDFISGGFPIGDRSPITEHRGVYFESLPIESKKELLRYRFSVESLPSVSKTELNSIFDRLNRNVKKLTPQELRHAQFDGNFISAVENLSQWLTEQLGGQFPRITEMSRRQMKDDEIVAMLLLFLEEGAKSYSTAAFDEAFARRDDSWDISRQIDYEFREVIMCLKDVIETTEGQNVPTTRLRNQADFYSLFGAIAELSREELLPEPSRAGQRLRDFAERLDGGGELSRRELMYLEAARSASNDAGPRKIRIEVMRDVLLGNELVDDNDPN
jgi:hypothetical protein